MNNQNSFFSMDKLVEFGMGMSMSQQIVKSMNDMMANMTLPPQIKISNPGYSPKLQNKNDSMPDIPIAKKEDSKTMLIPEVYYIAQDGKQTGPFSGTEIARLVMEKKVTADTYTWKPGMPVWKKAEEFSELLCLISLIPPDLSKQEN